MKELFFGKNPVKDNAYFLDNNGDFFTEEEMKKIADKLNVPVYCSNKTVVYSYMNKDKSLFIDKFGIDFDGEEMANVENALNELEYKFQLK